ncbi:FG-GAP-like repeat-containing protein [Sorangium sp. So ce131]|uniref:FG-GAP-like repeat-containing protein n=1 Tax=Sorangium sp. So ce131 TaxID=3133282 RepID=UPI003F62B0D8
MNENTLRNDLPSASSSLHPASPTPASASARAPGRARRTSRRAPGILTRALLAGASVLVLGQAACVAPPSTEEPEGDVGGGSAGEGGARAGEPSTDSASADSDSPALDAPAAHLDELEHPPLTRSPAAPVDGEELGRGAAPACGEAPCAAKIVPGAAEADGRSAIASSGRKGRGSNTQNMLPNNTLLADIDADGVSDFLQFTSNKLFVSKTDFEKTGVLHLYTRRPITRVLTGDFHGDRYDQTCLILDDGSLECYGISTDRRELWWWFTQGSFVGSNEDAIVGDFDGDRRDDILVYNRSGGAYRMYSVKGDHFFASTPLFHQGNLSGIATSGVTLRAGDFNGDGRDDIMAVNGWGQVLYYASVFDGTNHTFWWAFTTRSGLVSADDQVQAARIDDNAADDVVLRNRVTGATRFFRMEYQAGDLPALPGVALGQIDTAGGSQLFFGSLRGDLAEPGGHYREDAIVYQPSWNGVIRSDARWDGSGLTYWWVYTQYAPGNHAGWAPFTAKPWLVLKCKFRDIATEPQAHPFFRNLFTGDSAFGTVNYFRDQSYGSWDLTGTQIPSSWYTMSVTLDQSRSLSRWDRIQRCVDAYGGSTSGYVSVVALINGAVDSGAAGNRVLLDPGAWNVTFAAHEMAHGFGWGHSFDDTTRRAASWSGPGEYWDHWDIMSAMNVYTFNNLAGFQAGPEMNAPLRAQKSFLPAHRTLQLNPGSARQTATLKLAALTRPEADGPLMVRVGANNNDHYVIEYRMRSGWDQGIPRDTVLLHRVVNGCLTSSRPAAPSACPARPTRSLGA